MALICPLHRYSARSPTLCLIESFSGESAQPVVTATGGALTKLVSFNATVYWVENHFNPLSWLRVFLWAGRSAWYTAHGCWLKIVRLAGLFEPEMRKGTTVPCRVAGSNPARSTISSKLRFLSPPDPGAPRLGTVVSGLNQCYRRGRLSVQSDPIHRGRALSCTEVVQPCSSDTLQFP